MTRDDDWGERLRDAIDAYADRVGWDGRGDIQAWFGGQISAATATVNRWVNGKSKPGSDYRRKLKAIPEFETLVSGLARPRRTEAEEELAALVDRLSVVVDRLERVDHRPNARDA